MELVGFGVLVMQVWGSTPQGGSFSQVTPLIEDLQFAVACRVASSGSIAAGQKASIVASAECVAQGTAMFRARRRASGPRR
jgi:hypothetical protein